MCVNTNFHFIFFEFLEKASQSDAFSQLATPGTIFTFTSLSNFAESKHIFVLGINRCYYFESPHQDRFTGLNEASAERSHEIADISTNYLCSKTFFCEALFNKFK